MDLVAALGAAIDQAPLGPAGSFAKEIVAPTASLVKSVESKPPQMDGSMLLTALAGVSIGTAVSAGIGYGLGSWLYPEVGGMPFAKVGAVGYLVPVGLFVGISAVRNMTKAAA